MPTHRAYPVALVLASVFTAACARNADPTAAVTPAQAAGVAGGACTATTASKVRPIGSTDQGSSVALGRLGDATLAFVADADDEAIHVVDVDSGERLSTTLLDAAPSQLVLMKDGRLAVALAESSELATFDTTAPDRSLPQTCTAATAAEPVGLALTPGHETLVVTSDWGQSLGAYDSTTLSRRFEVPLPRSARSVVVSDDGKKAFVAHAAGARISTVDLRARKVDAIPLMSRAEREIERFTRDMRHVDEEERKQSVEAFREQLAKQSRTSCQGFALAKTSSPAGRILAPHVLVDPGDATNRTDGYGDAREITEVPSVAVIDARRGDSLAESLELPNPWESQRPGGGLNEECILPRTAAIDGATETLLVGCFGIDSIVAYDASSARPGQAELARWRVASGPTGIAVDHGHRRAVVWSQFDRTLNTLDLADLDPMRSGEADPEAVELRLDATPGRERTIAERLGRRLFHSTQDTRIAQDGRACASCHPAGRDDGLVWSTPDGPRRSIMLAGRVAGTAPYGWGGTAEDLEEHLQSTFVRLDGVGGLRSVELDALIRYLETLEPPPVAPGPDDPEVRRGAELFASAKTGCASCHLGEDLTDRKRHDVGSRADADSEAAFETPSLRYLASRGPFFHDGRYESLRELLIESDGKMGKVGHLDAGELDALEAYLLTL